MARVGPVANRHVAVRLHSDAVGVASDLMRPVTIRSRCPPGRSRAWPAAADDGDVAPL